VEFKEREKAERLTSQDSSQGGGAHDKGAVLRIDTNGDLHRLESQRDPRGVLRSRQSKTTGDRIADERSLLYEREERGELATGAQSDGRVIQRSETDTLLNVLGTVGDREGLTGGRKVIIAKEGSLRRDLLDFKEQL
jgi:hypothetical protein